MGKFANAQKQIQDTKALVDFNLICMGIFNQQLDIWIKHLDCRLDFYFSVIPRFPKNDEISKKNPPAVFNI